MDPLSLSLGRLIEMFIVSLKAEVRAGRSAERTLDYYERELGKLEKKLGGDRVAGELRRADIVPHVDSWHEIQTVKRLFNWAVTEELLKDNPTRRLTLPRIGRRTRVLTDAEVKLLLASARPWLREFLFAMQQTLARPQEIRGLHWSHMKELKPGKCVFVLTEFKAKKRRGDGAAVRIIPITAALATLLDEIKARGNPGPEIFRNAKGGPLKTSAVCLGVRRLRRQLGLDEGEPIVSYLFRHTGATGAIRKGVSVTMLREWMGHANIETTMHYLHLAGDDVVKAMEQVQAFDAAAALREA
jgi:integrase